MRSKFSQIARELENEIKGGRIDARLPSEQNLAKRFSCTQMTIRRALEVLKDKDLITKIPSVGVFVKPLAHTTIRIFWGCDNYRDIDDQIKECVRSHFKDISLEFIAENPERPINLNDVDLFRVPSTSSICYSKLASPFPNNLIDSFDSTHYYTLPFDIHRIDRYYFGLPFLFSPLLLLINKKLLADSGIVLPSYHLTLETLSDLSSWAESRNLALWTKYTVIYMLRAIIFNCAENSRLLCDVNTDELHDKLKKIWPFIHSKFIMDDEAPGVESKCLMSWFCRQNRSIDLRSTDYQLTTFPRIVGEKVMAAGDFLLLSGQSQNPLKAVEVAMFFLSEKVQQIIAKNKFGLPIMKSLAADSTDSREYRDDLFLCEARNIHANNAQEQDFFIRLDSLFKQHQETNCDLNHFFNQVMYEVTMARDKYAQINKVINRGKINNADILLDKRRGLETV